MPFTRLYSLCGCSPCDTVPAIPTGLEPATLALTRRRTDQLCYGIWLWGVAPCLGERTVRTLVLILALALLAGCSGF